MSGDDGFESPLDELFVQGATVHELSAAERAAFAKKREAREAHARREKRRQQRKGRMRPFLVVGGFLVLVLIAYKLFPGGDSHSTAKGLPKHVAVYYALPQGVKPDPKMPDAIRHDISVAQSWFASQTNGRVLRIDETAGVVDVQTRQLTNQAAELANRQDAPGLVNDQFVPRSGERPDTISLVFIPVARNTVGDTTDCGATQGYTSIIWVGSCGYQESINSAWPAGETKVIAHELLHALGAVPPCAPHYGHDGHTVDNVDDIMYWNAERGPAPLIELDPGHDDYYDTGNSKCFDVADHPAWVDA
jgi:hypothetical protein